ncbi:multidrug effflux MFS transporter [Desulfovibrio sp. OttesenSCG-928-C06]|nr:multidrug effflux MFS transporter [Desulfovibrio sp. OttesenSCG-928-C06]
MCDKAVKPVSVTRFALSLALITLLAPVATDMYLASMPDITRHLNVTYASVQLTLSVFLMAQGAGQLFFGPIIDRFGRRLPLLLGITIFALSSIWAGCSDSIATLLVSRFIQGLSGALLLVVGFSSVGDVAQGAQAASIFAVLMTIEGLAPIFAPIAGGFLDEHFGWRVVLWASSVMAAAAFANSFFNLRETLPVEKRIPLKPRVIVQTYKRIATDSTFLLPTLALSCVFFYLFAYIAGGAYLYQTVYGLSPDTFGLVFGITGSAVMLGAIASGRLVKRTTVGNVAKLGILLIIAGTSVALASYLTVGLPGIVAGFVISMFGLGNAEPALVSLTMSSQKTALGFTAALMGALHLMLSSLSTPISGVLLPINPAYWFIFLIISACVSMGIAVAANAALTRVAAS